MNHAQEVLKTTSSDGRNILLIFIHVMRKNTNITAPVLLRKCINNTIGFNSVQENKLTVNIMHV